MVPNTSNVHLHLLFFISKYRSQDCNTIRLQCRNLKNTVCVAICALAVRGRPRKHKQVDVS